MQLWTQCGNTATTTAIITRVGSRSTLVYLYPDSTHPREKRNSSGHRCQIRPGVHGFIKYQIHLSRAESRSEIVQVFPESFKKVI